MTTIVEKRKYRRLDISLPLKYNNHNGTGGYSGHSNTIDVCTGGVYFETTDKAIATGDTLDIDIGMAKGNTRFPQNSKISTNAKVVRACTIFPDPSDNSPSSTRYGIAAKFTSEFKLSL